MKCGVCGKEITDKARRAYCSPECYHASEKRRSRPKVKKWGWSKKRTFVCKWCVETNRPKKTPVKNQFERCHLCKEDIIRQGYDGISGEEIYIC
jgi:hypothetical protein